MVTKSRSSARGWGNVSFSVLISISSNCEESSLSLAQAIMSMSIARSA